MTALDLAVADIGYTEYPPNSNKTKYGKWYGMDGQPWCMEAVQYWYAMACTPLPYKTASCSAMLNWYKKNAPYAVSKTPSKGAIIIYNFGHTGLCESWTSTTITAVEGNTSPTDAGSQSNGGMVCRRTRKRSTVSAYIDPFASTDKPEGAQKSMKAIKGSTANEQELVKCWQGAIGAVKDGEAGIQTITDTACKLKAITKPMTFAIWGTPVIICPDIKVAASPKKSLSAFTNSINGGFYASGAPCSICVSDSIVKHAVSCHYWDGQGYPETVIYREEDGTFGIRRIKQTSELPKKLRWAVGGMGLLNFYDPAAEGFRKIGNKDFTDVLRKTNHSVLGIKNGYVYLVYAKNMTAADVNALAKKLGLESAIMLDGGSICGINGGEAFARINTKIMQYYVIQGV